MSDQDIITDLDRQVRKLRRSSVFPRDLKFPARRKIFMQVMAKSIGRSYKVGEILQRPIRVWLDAPPTWVDGTLRDAPVGASAWASGTTCIRRVR